MSSSFKDELQRTKQQSDFATRIASLDPTQHMVVDMLKEWAEKRLEWNSLPEGAGPCHPPPLRMLLLGTEGTGKTYTANAGITEARLMLESYDSVLTMALSRQNRRRARSAGQWPPNLTRICSTLLTQIERRRRTLSQGDR